ncbi:MAG: ribose-phosphate diphosphokinase [Haloarculaceae archaeon]
MIVSGSASQAFAAALSDATGMDLAELKHRRFPDGELLAGAPGFDADRAVLVAAPVSSDAHVELLQLQDAVREAGATDVTTVVPYTGHARENCTFSTDRALSSDAMARAVSTGTDRVVVVNPHEEAVCDYFDVPCETVDAAPRLAEPLPRDLTDPLFLAPDWETTGMAETVRDAYGAGATDYFETVPDRESATIDVALQEAAVAGRDVVLVNDVVATGTTTAASVDGLYDRGANRVFVACVHPVMAVDARNKLERAGVEAVYGTDTVEGPVSVVSAAPAVADVL